MCWFGQTHQGYILEVIGIVIIPYDMGIGPDPI